MKRILAIILTALTLLSLCSINLSANTSERTGITFEYLHEINSKGTTSNYGSEYYITQKRFEEVPRTLEAWVKIPSDVYSSRGGVILGNYAHSNAQDVFINFEIHNNGVPRLLLSKYDDETPDGKLVDYKFTNAVIPPDTWTHVTIVYGADENNRRAFCYLNGEFKQQSSVATWHEIDESFKDNIIYLGGDGRNLNEQAFRGVLSDVVVYSDVRTPAEVAADVNRKPDVNDENLMMYYEISSACQGKDIPDKSGNGFDMTYGKEWATPDEVSAIRSQTGKEYAYSIAFIPDTQYTAKNYPDKLKPIYDYLIDNKDSKNIQYVLSLGDMTDKNTHDEWQVVKAQTDRLNGVIPYTVMRGNHDGPSGSTEYFNEYYAKKDGYYYNYVKENGGFYEDNSVKNTYHTFTVGSTDYIILVLDFGANDQVLAWADSVLSEYSDHRAIITTHGYLNWDGTTLGANDNHAPTVNSWGKTLNNGDDMWNELISKHENVVIVASGHIPTDNLVYSTAIGDKGNTVHQFLIDAQSIDNTFSGIGMVAMMYFTEDGSDVFVEYYSTVRQTYLRTTNQFAFSISNKAGNNVTPPASNDQNDQNVTPPTTDSTSDQCTSTEVQTQIKIPTVIYVIVAIASVLSVTSLTMCILLWIRIKKK